MDLIRHFQPIVYITLRPDELTVRDVRTGRLVSGPPIAVLSREPKKRLLGVGEAGKKASTTQPVDLVNPFKHPRSLLSDFTVAQVVMRGFVRQLFEGRFFVPSPIVVLHPLVNPEGGFTQIEIRALRELAIGTGAAREIVWHGRPLSNNELLNLKFESGGEILN